MDVTPGTFTREDRIRYRLKVRRCLDVFALMLNDFKFDADRPMTGLELELNLIDPDPPSFHSKYHRFPAQDDPVQYPVFPGFVAAVSNGIFHDWLGRLGETDGHHLGLVLLGRARWSHRLLSRGRHTES